MIPGRCRISSDLRVILFIPRAPYRLLAASLGGIAWNILGAVQFAGAVTATEASLIAPGLTAGQAAVMGGYFVIEVADLDTALDWAARAPSALSASVEVRPVLPPMPTPGQ